jgi:hypothetical protein
LFGFFAAIGIVYLGRDLIEWLIFRKKAFQHTVIIDISGMDYDQIASILRHYRHLLESVRARALIGQIVLLHDPDSNPLSISQWDLDALLDCFDEPIKVCTPQEYGSGFSGGILYLR